MRWLWERVLKPILEVVGHAESVNTIIHAEFVRTLLLPTIGAVVTGAAGIFGGIPLMWVFMATALTFMGATVGLLAGSNYIERKNPLNKLSWNVVFNCDLNPTKAVVTVNRQQRRAVAKRADLPDLSPTQIDKNVARTLRVGQLGVEIVNNATFPISCFLDSAETTVADNSPPRSKFPKDKALIGPKDKFRLVDDRIDLNDMPCQRLSGAVKMVVKYGLPGKEKFEIVVEGTVEIIMERFGYVSQIQFAPKTTSATTN
jgi:hypothetical protein